MSLSLGMPHNGSHSAIAYCRYRLVDSYGTRRFGLYVDKGVIIPKVGDVPELAGRSRRPALKQPLKSAQRLESDGAFGVVVLSIRKYSLNP